MDSCTIQFINGKKSHTFSIENLPIYERNANGERVNIDHFLTEEGVCNAIKIYMKHNNLSGTYHDIVVYDEQEIIIAHAENLSERGNLIFTDDTKYELLDCRLYRKDVWWRKIGKQ